MAWVTVSCPDGPYEINVDGITRIIRSYAYARALSENSQTKTESHFFGPDIETVEIDWNQVKKQRETIATQQANDFYLKMSTGLKGDAGMQYLEGLIEDRDDYTDLVREKQKDAGKHTMDNIDQSVKRGEAGEMVATAIRDACIETELVLATGGAATIPEAMAGITLGSLGKGAAKWQDTNSFGQGVAEASIELVVNLATFGLGRAVPRDVVGSRTTRIVVALVFGGELKGALKLMPAGYLSPEDIAKGKTKSTAELLIPAAANMPSALARQLVEGLIGESKWAVPATVAIKLGLKYGAAAMAKPSKPGQPAVVGSRVTPQRGVMQDLAAMGRTSLSCTISNNIVDCSGPEEDFVLECALRPLYGASRAG